VGRAPDLVPVATRIFDGVLGRPQPEGPAARGGLGHGRPAARPARRGRRVTERGSRPTSRSRSPISTRGCAATAPRRSTT
jgi:hypothetical protein